MKKYLTLIFIPLLFLISCSQNITKEDKYDPPSLKSKPRLLYPKTAQENSLKGSSRIIIYISDNGIVDKALVKKSSGFDILDNAAVEYCKAFLFYPARKNNLPVYSVMEMVIKFDLSETSWNANEYVFSINNLYNEIENVLPSNRNEIEEKILNKHIEFVKNMSDVLKFNLFIEQVIRREISAEWKNDWDTWPLTFLLYHDFIQRFPDYTELVNVKTELKNSLIDDLNFIEQSPVKNIDTEIGKKNLLNKIKGFIKDEYPDIQINEIDPDAIINLDSGNSENLFISRK